MTVMAMASTTAQIPKTASTSLRKCRICPWKLTSGTSLPSSSMGRPGVPLRGGDPVPLLGLVRPAGGSSGVRNVCTIASEEDDGGDQVERIGVDAVRRASGSRPPWRSGG